MPRQELANTFSDGLMMDLNPINTPKSVLTDCLNGTYITYNGNEFVLQNDMGNYKLKNCKLPTNFIPVGVKGYADILYIVSYNPFTKEVEIGSYPAPQSIFTTSNEENKVPSTDEELAPFNWENTAQYSELIKTNKKPLFIFANSDEETYKLNPGDEFKLEGINNMGDLEYIYQHLNFYVIDEDNKLYNLDDNDVYFYNGEEWSGDTMRKVFWETPGWLAAQYDLYVPDKFNLNLKSLNVPEFLIISDDDTSEQAEGEINLKTQFEASMDLSSQVVITDLLFQNELNKHTVGDYYRDLYIRYKVETTSGTFQGFTVDPDITIEDNGDGSYDIPCKWHNYQDDVITAFVNCHPIWWMDNPKDKDNPQNYDGVIAVTAYPIIKYNDKILEFTQFKTELRFPLNTLKNSNNITVADSIYKWSVDDDSCTISFNINGPFINANNITGRYEIYRINLFNKKPTEFNPNTTPADINNPKSYSSFTLGTIKPDEPVINTDSTDPNNLSAELVWENGKWIKKSITATNEHFYSDETTQHKLLMCEGKLSNLVLYGQNTLNINWNSSNKYKLTGYENYYTNPDYDSTDDESKPWLEDISYIGYENKTKTIDFNKEGGIYIFRVILEQGTQQLAESQQVLIPSEVFNEWFGSIDNYNNIYLNQWINKFILNYKINNIDIINANVTDINETNAYTYISDNKTTEINTEFFDNGQPKDNICNLFYENKKYYDTDGNHNNDTLKIDFDTMLTWQIECNYSNSILKGNLWNPIYKSSILFKNNEQNIGTYNKASNKIHLFNLPYEQNINYFSNRKQIYTVKEGYPFYGILNDPEYQFRFGVQCFSDQGGGLEMRCKYHNEANVETEFIYCYKKIGFFPNEAWSSVTNHITGKWELFESWKEMVGKQKYNCFVPRLGYMNYIGTHNYSKKTALATGTILADINRNNVWFWAGDDNIDRFNSTFTSLYTLIPFGNKYNKDIKDGLVFIKLPTAGESEKFRSLLLSLKIIEKTEPKQSVYAYTISNKLNFLDNYQYTITKMNETIQVELLRADDTFFAFHENIKQLDTITDSNLLKNNSINFSYQKTTPTINISPKIIEVDLSNTTIYKSLSENFNSSIEQYNNNSNLEIERLQNSDPIKEIDLDKYSSLTTQEIPKSIETFLNKIIGNNGEKLTINNASWDNNPETALVASCYQGGEFKHFRWVLGCYETFSF